jgi:hypothetical protein
MARKCTDWRAALSKRVPQVTVGARDAEGHDLTEVSVTIDGEPSGAAVSGQAVVLDPGEHRLRFTHPGDSPVETTVILREGEPPRSIVVTLGVPKNSPPQSEAPAGTTSPATPSVHTPGVVPLGTLVFGGVSLVAGGTFAFFALRGAGDRSSLGCDAGCRSGDFTRVRNEFLVANVALGVTVVSLGLATWFLLSHPSSDRPARIAGANTRARWSP